MEAGENIAGDCPSSPDIAADVAPRRLASPVHDFTVLLMSCENGMWKHGNRYAHVEWGPQRDMLDRLQGDGCKFVGLAHARASLVCSPWLPCQAMAERCEQASGRANGAEPQNKSLKSSGKEDIVENTSCGKKAEC